MDAQVVGARAIDQAQYDRLFILEVAKGAEVPAMMTHVTFEGQGYLVTALVDFGDGHGPLVLALRLLDP